MTCQRNSKKPNPAVSQKTSRPTSLGRWFYQKNKKLLEHPVNKTFEEVLWMTDHEFQEWMTELRRVVVHLWDNDGVPLMFPPYFRHI